MRGTMNTASKIEKAIVRDTAACMTLAGCEALKIALRSAATTTSLRIDVAMRLLGGIEDRERTIRNNARA